MPNEMKNKTSIASRAAACLGLLVCISVLSFGAFLEYVPSTSKTRAFTERNFDIIMHQKGMALLSNASGKYFSLKSQDRKRTPGPFWIQVNNIFNILNKRIRPDKALLDPDPTYASVTHDPNRDPKYIPKIIHQTYSSESIPRLYKNWIRSCLRMNPDWRYMFWSDRDARHFIRDYYPTYLDMFDKYNNKLMKADAMRYFVLNHYGGLYMDMDMRCLRPIKDLLSDKRMVLVPEPHIQSMLLYKKFSIVTNAIMAAEPSHPFLSYVINRLQKFQRKTSVSDVIYVTGPNMLQSVFESYQKDWPCNADEVSTCQVFVADPSDLLPTVDRIHYLRMRKYLKNCYEKLSYASFDEFKTCVWVNFTDYRGTLNEKAYTNHLWKHLGHRTRVYGEKLSIEKIVGKYKIIERYSGSP